MVDDFLTWMNQTYAQIGELKSTCGSRHDYLGMTLDYGVPGQVTIDMVNYVKLMVSFFPDKLEKPKVSAPWTNNLFIVNEKSPFLSKDKSELFYTIIAKGLFLQTWATRYFSCNRVSYDTRKRTNNRRLGEITMTTKISTTNLQRQANLTRRC
jgi:hypothetical protein